MSITYQVTKLLSHHGSVKQFDLTPLAENFIEFVGFFMNFIVLMTFSKCSHAD